MRLVGPCRLSLTLWGSIFHPDAGANLRRKIALRAQLVALGGLSLPLGTSCGPAPPPEAQTEGRQSAPTQSGVPMPIAKAETLDEDASDESIWGYIFPGIPSSSDDCARESSCLGIVRKPSRFPGRVHVFLGTVRERAPNDQGYWSDCKLLKLLDFRGAEMIWRRCVLVNDAEEWNRMQCAESEGCSGEGLCSPDDGRCIAKTDADCSRSVMCRQWLQCRADAGVCVEKR
jgi:hypothetical protein